MPAGRPTSRSRCGATSTAPPTHSSPNSSASGTLGAISDRAPTAQSADAARDVRRETPLNPGEEQEQHQTKPPASRLAHDGPRSGGPPRPRASARRPHRAAAPRRPPAAPRVADLRQSETAVLRAGAERLNSPWTSYSTGTPQLSPSTAKPMLGRTAARPAWPCRPPRPRRRTRRTRPASRAR